ncbi:MAG: hypothetical protein QM714_19050 [Nocardioides sp.]|uniref:hypothetical protein n=1 Tax=Nocardioides sp. TaxID=35761 RepID=UPI0039E2E0E0
MIGHLGARVSQLLDGQLTSEDEDRAWHHVMTCHQCRDLVEREGWVKTRLAGLSFGQGTAPDDLKGSLLDASALGTVATGGFLESERPRVRPALAALGGGALGAALVGMVAFVGVPGSSPTMEVRSPGVSTRPSSPVSSTGDGILQRERREVAHGVRPHDTMVW